MSSRRRDRSIWRHTSASPGSAWGREMADSLRLLIVGAHPDDADYAAGGTAALYRRLGHTVLMVSLTNGDAGHHQISGPELASRRLKEAQAAAAVIGATYQIFDNHDGLLEPTIANRLAVI